MQDRQPTKPGRMKITPEDGSTPFFAIVTMADEPIEVGTPPIKANLLSDQYSIPFDANTVNDMWGKIVPVGAILWFTKDKLPPGRFLLCDGSGLSIEDYPELFAVIGSTFKSATDTTFYLPDLRAAFIRGAGTQGEYSATFGDTQDATGIPDRQNTVNYATTFDNYDYSYTGGSSNDYSAFGTTKAKVYKTRPFNVVLTPIIKY